MVESKILLVEGKGDKEFFTQFLSKICPVTVSVKTPGDAGAKHKKNNPPHKKGDPKDGKHAALSMVKNVFLELITNSRLQNFAIILDADYEVNKEGYTKTLEDTSAILAAAEYKIDSSNIIGNSGFIFKNNDKELPSIGLWIMSKDGKEGMLEDFLKQSATLAEKKLLTHAATTVANLQKHDLKRFNDIHQSKADVATWLAWQASPALGAENLFLHNLLDLESDTIKNLKTWLQVVFPKETL